MRIDSHHHFWRYDPAQYDWIGSEVLRHDFLPANLETEINAVGIDGVVSVQARQTLEETQWLLELAGTNEFIKGVVGWVPLTEGDAVRGDLERFAADSHFKSVRHGLQGEPDNDFALRPDFNAGIAALKDFGLAYDLLILERHLPPTIALVDQHPEQVFILDHIAKPFIKEGTKEPWAQNIRELAKRPHVYCKVSGMVTEAEHDNWTDAHLQPYFDTVLEAFGPERLMFGSDWPVCLRASGYARWYETVQRLAASLSETEQAALFGGVATRAYRI